VHLPVATSDSGKLIGAAAYQGDNAQMYGLEIMYARASVPR
jgi:hypothetical protein